jgi:predicted MFS family arabinose efflux permease
MSTPLARLAILTHAAALALGPAVSLGLARFAYALLLPPMRADLGWSYFTAGAMNTVNAAGYLLGAIVMPRAMARGGARAALWGGGVATALLLAAHGWARADAALYALRFASGAASAATFVGGGLLAAQLAGRGPAAGVGPGLVLGLYYGGTGIGIIASALLVPAFGEAWPRAWIALGALALALTALMTWGAGPAAAMPSGSPAGHRGARGLGWGMAAYFFFGLGYIGYMTFVVTLLREQQLPGVAIVGFYALLGAGVVASSWLWAGLLQRHRDGRPLALLNALLALATLLPLLWAHPFAAFASGLLFGCVFLSVVASTTALVRHNLPPAAWGAGIGAFTIVFAAGQIVGPGLVGALSDAFGGLRPGFALSAAALALGAGLAARQRALAVGARRDDGPT